MDLIALVSTVFSVVALAVTAVVAVVVGRRRGLDRIDAQADSEIKRLVDAQGERLRLLEKANAEKDLTIAAQNQTIASLTSRQTELQSKVAELEHQLAVERRVTADMRRNASGDGR